MCVRAAALSPDEVAALREGIDANLAAPAARAIVASRPEDPGFFIEDFCSWGRNPDYRAHVSAQPGAARRADRQPADPPVPRPHADQRPGRRARPGTRDQPYHNVEAGS